MAGNITDYSSAGDIASLGTTVLTDMARAFEQFPGDPCAQFFPGRNIADQTIVIERLKRGVGIAPIVDRGQPDAITDSALVDRRIVQPVFVRESDFIPQDVINNLRQAGTLNEKVGLEFVSERVRRLTDRNNHLWAVLRAQALLGGINYTDPRTGASINVNMQIPAGNLRSLLPLGGSRTWDNIAQSLPINDLRRFKQYIYTVAKTSPTHLVMRSSLKLLLELNKDIVNRVEGSGARNAAGFVEYANGEITRIAGMEILVCDTLYDNPVTGTRDYVWPVNKVAVVAMRHEQAQGEFVGQTVYAVGEDPMGRSGLWMRSGPDTTPPAPPGRSVQMGNCGLPFLKYPDWVGILTVGNVSDIDNAINNAV
jgi:hypothetical protein